MVELYRRNIWHDARTVNVMATALFSSTTKVAVAALNFFVGRDEDWEDDNSDDDEDTVSVFSLSAVEQCGHVLFKFFLWPEKRP